MILARPRRRRLTVAGVAMIGLLVLGMALSRPACLAQTPAQSGAPSIGSAEQLRGLLTERYEICKRIAESVEKLFELGRASLSEWRSTRVAAYTAQADLSADTANRVKVYEEMVDFLRKAEQVAHKRAENGSVSDLELSQARLATIDAQIALEKLRLGQNP